MKNKFWQTIEFIVVLLLFGFAAGFLFDRLYYKEKHAEERRAANALIDYVIAGWTGVRSDEMIDDSGTSLHAQLNNTTSPLYRVGYFPDTVKILAKQVEQTYHVPAAVTLAQWVLESSWGKSDLGVNNLFGHTFAATGKFTTLHKFVPRKEKSLNKRTLKFTVYTSIAECFEAHGKYLSQSKLYRAAFFTSDAENFARAIACSYAEDPEYATKLITIMRRYQLEDN